MILQTEALNKRIKESDDNLFLIYGEEDFFIELAVNSIKRKYLEKGFEQMDSVRLDFNNKSVDIDKIVENIELPSWSSPRRVVEVVNFDIDKDSADKLPSVLEKIPSGTVLLFVTDKFDKRKKKLYDSFTKNGIVCEVKYLDDTVLSKYIKAGLAKSGLTIDQDAVESIISRYDRSMRKIDSAIRRFSLYCSAVDAKNVTFEIVDELCEPDVHARIFDIMDAVGTGNAAQALVLLDNLIRLKEPLPSIRFMLARHFKELICAKDLNNSREIVSRLGLGGKSFKADKLLRQSRNFRMDKLILLYNLCYRNDYDIKHGNADERASLESFIVLASGK